MGSATDRPTANKAEKILDKFGIDYETFVASAHRTPDRVVEIIRNSDAEIFIALAGLSAALPGVVAAHTRKPVIGIPCASSSSPGNLDSLYPLYRCLQECLLQPWESEGEKTRLYWLPEYLESQTRVSMIPWNPIEKN